MDEPGGRHLFERRYLRIVAALGTVAVLAAVSTVIVLHDTHDAHGSTAAPGHHGASSRRKVKVRDPGSPSPVRRAKPVPPPVQQPVLELGAYAGPGDSAALGRLEGVTGSPLDYAMDFLSASNWNTIADPAWILGRWSGAGYRLVLGVPMLPPGATLAAGAAGAYEPYFSHLGELLVADGESNAILAVGWLGNADGTPWTVTTSVEAHEFVSYWRRIVETLRAIDGARFSFAWVVAGGYGTIAPAAIYPGDKYVDIVATDVFDQSVPGRSLPGTTWSQILHERYGPNWLAAFAVARHKPVAIESIGLVPRPTGAGDDPAFVTDLLTWARGRDAAYAILWDYGRWALDGGAFPRSLCALARFAGGHQGRACTAAL